MKERAPKTYRRRTLKRRLDAVADAYNGWRDRLPLVRRVGRQYRGGHAADLDRRVERHVGALCAALDEAGSHGLSTGLELAYERLYCFANDVDEYCHSHSFDRAEFRRWAQGEWGRGMTFGSCHADARIPVGDSESADLFLARLWTCAAALEAVDRNARVLEGAREKGPRALQANRAKEKPERDAKVAEKYRAIKDLEDSGQSVKQAIYSLAAAHPAQSGKRSRDGWSVASLYRAWRDGKPK